MTGALIPLPEPLPAAAPAWLLWGLLMLTFVLHMIAMNLLAGGSFVVAYARLRHAGNAHAAALVSRFAALAPVLVAATVTFGVAPLLFLQVVYGRVFFVSSILMAWLWLGVVPVVILVYSGMYSLSMRKGRQTPAWLHLATAALLAGIAFVYTTNMTLMLRPEQFGPLYAASGSGVHLNLGDPTLWPRWLHMMLGAIGVAGLAIAGFGLARRRADEAFARWAGGFGAGASALATALNLIAGGWWLMALPAAVRQQLVSPGIPAVVLGAGVLLGIATCALLVRLARRPSGTLAIACGGGMVLTLIAMAFTRDAVRSAALGAAGFVPATWVVAQWLPIALFVVLLIVALGTVGWMVSVLARAPLAAKA